MYRIGFVFFLLAAWPAAAQEHQHPAPTPTPTPAPAPAAQEHVHHGQAQDSLFSPRDGSGTSWLPEQSPMYAGHGRAGNWELMWHGNAFLQYINESAEEHRGAHQTGSINWVMGMARRRAGSGRVGVRGMLSLEPWTIGGCGYPDLLATGESCDGDTIHDRQHPHDLFMELALEYDRPLRGSVHWFAYGGPVGEPALGPVAYPHRVSAMSNPIAPIGHHWFDATHISFGVVTTGVRSGRWKVEASAFNGREPDENRTDFDLGALDSYSARVSVAPAASTVLQVSAGRLNDAEREAGLPPNDVTRVTASAAYNRMLGASALWASTIAWGLNDEPIGTTQALLVESTVSLRNQHVGFMRVEVAGKPAHDLHVHESTEVFTVGKIQAGYAYYLRPTRGVQAGVGGSLAGSLVPSALAPRYGGRIAPGIAVFLTVRAAAHAM
jgi:hypothetical protein